MLQNTPTVYLSRLASPSLQRFLQSNGFQLKSLDVPVVYPEISTHADILLCQLGLWEKAQIFHGDPEKLTRNYPGNMEPDVSKVNNNAKTEEKDTTNKDNDSNVTLDVEPTEEKDTTNE